MVEEISKEEISKMSDTEKKTQTEPEVVEQKSESLPVEAVKTETVAEIVVEAKTAEPVQAVAEESLSKTEIKSEQKVEELAKNEVAAEVIKTKEELALIKEAREELIATYARVKDLETKVEHLTAELTGTTKEKENLSLHLKRYVEAEERLQAKEKQDRLEKLSVKFKELGREKSIEQLSAMSEDTLKEFEVIVDTALAKVADTTPMPDITAPSQGISTESLSSEALPVTQEATVEKKVIVEQKRVPVQATQKQFFANVCKNLTREQQSQFVGSKARLM